MFLLARNVGASSNVNSYAQNEAVTIALFKEFQDDVTAAQAVFVPGNDVAGYSNSDYHAVSIYQWDQNHNGHFWEYCYKNSSGECSSSQTNGTLQRYSYTWSASGGTNAAVQSAAISAFSSFTFRVLTTAAQYEDATLDPYAYRYFVQHPPSFSGAKQYKWGYPGVTSSTNDLYVLTVKWSDGETRSIAFGKHHIVFAQTAIYGSATPTPNPICDGGCPSSGVSLAFRNPIASAQSTTVTETNYGTRSTTPAQTYSVSGCSGDSTFAPSSPITPSSNGTGAATISVTPVKQVASSGLSCTLDVRDNVNQTVPIAVSIGRTYAPTASGGGVVSAPSGSTITVSERNYVSSPQVGFSVRSYSPSGTCTASAGSSAMSSDGTYTYSTPFTVSFQKQNIACVVTFVDTYGQTTSMSTTQQAASGPVTAWPAAILYPASGSSLGAVAFSGPVLTPGAILNRLLGGGVAEAAVSACAANQPRAYTSSGPSSKWAASSVLANASDPYGLGYTTNSNGCLFYKGTAVNDTTTGSIVVNETSYSNTFWQPANNCGTSLRLTGWTPSSASGPTALAIEVPGSSANVSSCSLTFGDNRDSGSSPPSDSYTSVTAGVQYTSYCTQSVPCILMYSWWDGTALNNANCQVGIAQCGYYAGYGVEGTDGQTPPGVNYDQCCVAYSDASGNLQGTANSSGLLTTQESAAGTCWENVEQPAQQEAQASGGGDGNYGYYWIVIVPPGSAYSSGQSINQQMSGLNGGSVC